MNLGITGIATSRTVPFKGVIIADENALERQENQKGIRQQFKAKPSAPGALKRGFIAQYKSNPDFNTFGIRCEPEHPKHKIIEEYAINYLTKILDLQEGKDFKHIPGDVPEAQFNKLMDTPLDEVQVD